jgi:hypothetical protein
MAWPGQNPLATDVILHLNVPCAGGSPAYLEIDKLPDGRYRATVGTLFEHQEICRRAISRRWCGTPTRWPGAARSMMSSLRSGRCERSVEVGRQKLEAPTIAAPPVAHDGNHRAAVSFMRRCGSRAALGPTPTVPQANPKKTANARVIARIAWC